METVVKLGLINDEQPSLVRWNNRKKLYVVDAHWGIRIQHFRLVRGSVARDLMNDDCKILLVEKKSYSKSSIFP